MYWNFTWLLGKSSTVKPLNFTEIIYFILSAFCKIFFFMLKAWGSSSYCGLKNWILWLYLNLHHFRSIKFANWPIYKWFAMTWLQLTHWGWVTHIHDIYISNLAIVDSVNGLWPNQCQAIFWTNAGMLSIWPLGTNFSEILIEILTFSFKKIHLKVSSAKWRPFCLGLSVLKIRCQNSTSSDGCQGNMSYYATDSGVRIVLVYARIWYGSLTSRLVRT